VIPVMLSHASRREGARVESLAQLAAAGIHPQIIESHATEKSDAEVRRRAYDALRRAAGDALLFLEDDILVRPALLNTHLALAEASGVTTALCAINARHYPPGVLSENPMRVRLEPIPNYAADRGFHGSMAVYLPPALVEYGWAHPEQFVRADGTALVDPVIPPDFQRGKVTGFDFWLKHTAQRFGGMRVALPNSVDHDDRGSVHGSRGGAWRSPTFSVPEARCATLPA